MHEFIGVDIDKSQLIDLANKMLTEKRRLLMINGYINEEKQNVVAYNFDIDGGVTTYFIKGESEIPSITPVFGASARWPEEEIEEMMPVKFTNLNRTGRLFLPEEFKDGEGQILVIPISELKKYKEKEENK